jgi:hypothetical protein
MELRSVEERDWMFKKFADLFQAYATAQIEKRQGPEITARVAEIIDGFQQRSRSNSANQVGGSSRNLGGGGGGRGGGGAPPVMAVPYGQPSPRMGGGPGPYGPQGGGGYQGGYR